VVSSGVGIEFASLDDVLAINKIWVQAKPAPEAEGEPAPEAEGEPTPEAEGEPAPGKEGGGTSEEEAEIKAEPKTDGMGSLYHRMKALNAVEKKHLALRANKPERHFLSRDNNKGLHVFVLRNPNVNVGEVASFLNYPRYSVHAIRIIADTPEWVSSPLVQRNLITHPATPLEIARMLLSKMNENQIRMVQRSGRLNAVLAKDAKKRVANLRERKRGRR
jgi:hypothetical protein